MTATTVTRPYDPFLGERCGPSLRVAMAVLAADGEWHRRLDVIKVMTDAAEILPTTAENLLRWLVKEGRAERRLVKGRAQLRLGGQASPDTKNQPYRKGADAHWGPGESMPWWQRSDRIEPASGR